MLFLVNMFWPLCTARGKLTDEWNPSNGRMYNTRRYQMWKWYKLVTAGSKWATSERAKPFTHPGPLPLACDTIIFLVVFLVLCTKSRSWMILLSFTFEILTLINEDICMYTRQSCLGSDQVQHPLVTMERLKEAYFWRVRLLRLNINANFIIGSIFLLLVIF